MTFKALNNSRGQQSDVGDAQSAKSEPVTWEQGPTYEEYDVNADAEFFGGDEGGSSPKNSAAQEVDTSIFEKKGLIGKLNKKILLFGGLGIVLLIACVIFYAIWQSGVEKQKYAEELQQQLEQEEFYSFQYTPDERYEMRIRGLTADEIENKQLNEYPASQVIEELDLERQAYLDETVKPLYDGASAKYRDQEAKTWVGGPALSFQSDRSEDVMMSRVFNARYVKLPATNHQAFICITLEDKTKAWMMLPPWRYVELEPEGNIVVNIEYTVTVDGKEVITSMSEMLL